MKDDDNFLLAMILILTPLSFAAIGSGAGVIPGLERHFVAVLGWVSPEDFLQLFGISRVAPGPGTMLVTLLGWRVAGWTGALVATTAFYLPPALLAFAVVRLTRAHRAKRWYRIAQTGLAPVGTGLLISGVISIFRLSGPSPLMLFLAFGALMLLIRRPEMPVPILLGMGGTLALILRVLSGGNCQSFVCA